MCIDYIGIDPSLSCTAMVINNKKFIFANSNLLYNKKQTYVKWVEKCSNYCNINTYTSKNYKLYEYSIVELQKIQLYDTITDNIISTIENNVSTNTINIFMEGYSYSALAGPLIDLVSFSTILRIKIIKSISKNLTIVSPSTLKLETAKIAYLPTKVGKKLHYRNNDGIRGGKFKKREMLLALLDSNIPQDDWMLFLHTNKNELLSKKSIPKPIDDINDALLLYLLGSKSKFNT